MDIAVLSAIALLHQFKWDLDERAKIAAQYFIVFWLYSWIIEAVILYWRAVQ
jgi:hypothetical protein